MLRAHLGDLAPLLLHSSSARNYSQIVELTYPIVVREPDGFERSENFHLSRSRLLAHSLLEQVEVSNYGRARRSIRLGLEFDAEACRPQAWASGAPLLMLRSYGGLSADAPAGILNIVQPELPAWLDRSASGPGRVDLTLTWQHGVTGLQVARKEGDIEVLITQ